VQGALSVSRFFAAMGTTAACIPLRFTQQPRPADEDDRLENKILNSERTLMDLLRRSILPAPNAVTSLANLGAE